MDEKDKIVLDGLKRREKKDIKDYWMNYIRRKDICLYYWNYYYTASYKKDELVKFIPDNVWYVYICNFFNDSVFSKQIDNKCLYDLYLSDIRMPHSIIKSIDGCLYDSNYQLINEDEVEQLLDRYNKVIVKQSIESYGGKNVNIYTKSNYAKLYDDIKKMKDYVIQDVVTQSNCLNKLNPSCINTIRISTLFIKGQVIVLCAMLRLGIDDAEVDNASAGGIFVGIDLDTGKLKKTGYSRKPYNEYSEHPNTHVKFEGYQIKNFEKIISIIKCKAKQLSKTRLIAWDFAIDITNEPILIEVNLENHGLESLQIANGPYFGEYTDMVLDYVFNSEIMKTRKFIYNNYYISHVEM